MDIKEKINYLKEWCERQGLSLELEGECGLGRDCVGVVSKCSGYDVFPDYKWYDDQEGKRIDTNGSVWIPDDAYHKHPCVAVLGRGERSICQLYDWCKWFDEYGFCYRRIPINRDVDKQTDLFSELFESEFHHRMVKKDV